MEKQQRCECCSCLPPRDPCGSPAASQRVQPRGICCSPTSSSPNNSSSCQHRTGTNPAGTLLRVCAMGFAPRPHDSTESQLLRGAQGTTTAGRAASHEGGTYFKLSYLLPPQWGSDFAPNISHISISSSPSKKPCLAVAKAETSPPDLLFIGGCPTLCAFLQLRFGLGEKSIAQEPMWVRYEPGCCHASETCQHAAETAPVLRCCDSHCQSTSSGVNHHTI